ncbi:hypothetical protein OYE22_06880 [Streptomyces sp. 71268]|uniref:hypothetical protein n=1 Tax=Streptomyces sp. 71268 TaxID=3002640 RepID=UPI0023F86CFE|nr:hypothetical protein [Streptomyces sp. 71268]WEV24950.1 hypothetical protein OYE22_06880 [Streptomyces sp. 71268]
MRNTTESEAKEKTERLELSVAQVAGSALAAVAAAVLASRLGVYGTIIGAGVVSVVATAGGSVFQHFFHRTGEQLRVVTVHHRPRARQVPHTGDGAPEATRASAPPTRHAHTSARRSPASGAAYRAPTSADGRGGDVPYDEAATRPLPVADADRTRPLPRSDLERTRMMPRASAAAMAAEADRTRALPRVSGTGSPEARAGADADRTRALRRVDQTTRRLRRPEVTTADGPPPAARGAGEVSGAPADEFTDATTHGTRWRGGRRLALAALGVFLLAMAVITGIEWAAGGPVSNVWGDDKSGTTFSNSVSRSADRPTRPDPAPTTERPATGGDDRQPDEGHDPDSTPDATRPDGGATDPTRTPTTPPAPAPTGGGADQRTPGPAPSTPAKPGTPSAPGTTVPTPPGATGESGTGTDGGGATAEGDGGAPGGQRPDRPAGQGGPATQRAD